MNLVFVHGRAQGGKDPAALAQEWLAALEAGWAKGGVVRPAISEIRLPFYADKLDSWVARTKAGVANLRARGCGDGEMEELEQDDIDLMQELLDAAGVSDNELGGELEPGVSERGPQNWEWFQAASRALDKRVPWLADFGVDQFTADVGTYLTNPLACDEVDDIVVTDIKAGNCVVVAHSLGTVVAYHVLAHRLDAVGIPLFMTLGSPLGISSIKRRLPGSLRFPRPPLGRWINAADERDYIALRSRLAESFVPGIVDQTHVDNGEDAHSILGYLADALVARQIAEALNG